MAKQKQISTAWQKSNYNIIIVTSKAEEQIDALNKIEAFECSIKHPSFPVNEIKFKLTGPIVAPAF